VGLDRAAIEGLRAMILADGIQQLAVGDLRADEVAGLAWSVNPAHLRSVAAALQRAAQGLEDYLVARAPAGEPVAKLRVDYTSEDDTGVLSQLATMGPLHGLGIATMLIGAGEQRVRARGLAFAALGVEDDNPRHAASTSGSDTRHPAASPHHGNTKTTTASCGCTKLRSRSCASACNARGLTTPRPGQPESVIPRFHRPTRRLPRPTGVSQSPRCVSRRW
jgi:GNAT superfamily N-acetyltransferase